MKYKIILLAVLSIAVMLLGLIIDVHYEAARPPQSVSLVIEALKTLGATGLAVVFLNFWIETEDWRQYFEERIKSIVIQQDYMKSLDQNTMKNVLVNLMKARFKDTSVDQKDGFLDHFDKNIMKYIGSPFREDVVATVYYTRNDEDKWLVKDRIEFSCRKIGSSIQEKLNWVADEADQVRSIRINVSRPNEDGYSTPETLISSDTDNEAFTKLKIGVPLTGYKDLDHLKVEIIAEYLQDRSRYSAWGMASPSRNCDVTVIYPEGYQIANDNFVTLDNSASVTKGPTYLRLIYKGWLLPENGLVWHLSVVPSVLRQAPATAETVQTTAKDETIVTK